MLVLKDATVVDWKSLAITRGHFEVTPKGPRKLAKLPSGGKVLDCTDRLVTKSFAVAHHHLYSALATGMPPPPRTPRSFVDILKLVWWRLDKALDDDMVLASALAGAVSAAKSGATFVIDHHSSPNAAKGSLDLIAKALDEVGLSHLLCLELSDRDGAGRREEGLEETQRYLEDHQGLVGLHASFTVEDRLLRRAVELAKAERTGLHVHAAEAPSDQQDCLKRRKERILERFAKAGVLDSPRTLLAHGLHLSARERRLFKDSQAWLVHNPESNANNQVGLFDPDGLGDRILLGTDGMHGDMLAASRAAYQTGQTTKLGPDGAYRRLRRVHDYLERNGFEGDGGDNLVVLAYTPHTPVTPANWLGHFFYGLDRSHVESVISKGKVIVEKGALTTVDEAQVRRFARKQAERLWRRL